MENMGSEVPIATDRWIKFVNMDASGKDCYVHPQSIQSVEIRDVDPLRARIRTQDKRIDIEGTNAQALVDWLDRISGLIIGAEL